MNFEQLLTYVLIFACVTQFYYSFIKGRGAKKNFGDEIYMLRKNALKMKFLGLLFIFVAIYLVYSVKMSSISALGILIVFYILMSIFDFTKSKVITSYGIGEKSIYNNHLYNFIAWDEIIDFEWSDKRETMLVFKYKKNGKLYMNDWEVCKNDKDEVDRIFKANVQTQTTN